MTANEAALWDSYGWLFRIKCVVVKNQQNNGMMVPVCHTQLHYGCQRSKSHFAVVPGTNTENINMRPPGGGDTPTGASSGATRRVHCLSCRLSAHTLAWFVPPPSNLIQSMTFPDCWWRLLSSRPPAHQFISISLSGDFFIYFFIIGRLLLTAGG